jgi:ABC-type bacteriocin/lantibiotic exporter with double-glycine peptidase domain
MVPLVLQSADHDCGEAAYACLVRYWEGRGRRVRAHPLHGTHPDQLEPALRDAGFGVLSGEMDVQSLQDFTGRGWPAACLIQREGVGHWVVCHDVRRGGVFLMDPADGFIRLREAEFVSRWRDSDRRNTPYVQFGIVPWM